jgi:predicted nucleic acid-binding protein
MPLVIDASIAACWALKDEEDALATAALARLETDEAYVPAVWWFELRNALIVAERRSRLSVADSATFLARVAGFPIIIDRTPLEAELLSMTRRHRLTVYDAAYLELAHRKGVPLATLDGPLARAARAEHVPLLGAGN